MMISVAIDTPHGSLQSKVAALPMPLSGRAFVDSVNSRWACDRLASPSSSAPGRSLQAKPSRHGKRDIALWRHTKSENKNIPGVSHFGSGRPGTFLQNQLRVGYTTKSYIGVARGSATGVDGFAGC